MRYLLGVDASKGTSENFGSVESVFTSKFQYLQHLTINLLPDIALLEVYYMYLTDGTVNHDISLSNPS